MSVITPPSYVRQVLTTLQARGHSAYLVGGCVRDMLLGVHPQDWDVCTGALPEEVLALFPGSRPTGLKHGTVTVVLGKKQVEVTTFRREGRYADHRHPDEVSFVGDLTTDLSRRDFTINAIALPPDGLIVDPFGGVRDLRDRLIRCVGVPAERFEEDALRMFRALRFSARLGFSIEEETMAAIVGKAPLAASLAPERIRDEVEKLLLTRRPEKMAVLIDAGLLDAFLKHRRLDEFRLLRLNGLPRKPLYRWAALCVLLEEAGCIDSTESFLLALRLDGRTLRCCCDCAALLRTAPPTRSADWKRLLRAYGVDSADCAARVHDALLGGGCRRALREVLKSGECFSLKHLAVSGDDLLALGLRGKALGDMLDFLLDYVIEFPENNRRELLLSLAGNTEET
ncbi:MAG: polynucleotide adenylyltransferase [Oscillospiraceae bacterium]|nr:polynucleotide adenylyltransferase [Oscillospiraceae bacterium]